MSSDELKTYVAQILSLDRWHIDDLLTKLFDEWQINKLKIDIKAFDNLGTFYNEESAEDEDIFSLKEEVRAEVVSKLVRTEYITSVAKN